MPRQYTMNYYMRKSKKTKKKSLRKRDAVGFFSKGKGKKRKVVPLTNRSGGKLKVQKKMSVASSLKPVSVPSVPKKRKPAKPKTPKRTVAVAPVQTMNYAAPVPEPKPVLPKVESKTKKETSMTHLERMHLLAFAKQYGIDPQEVDLKLNYYENKQHLHEVAMYRGVSQEELVGAEAEAKEWANQYQDYLNQMKGELELAGFEVSIPT